MNDRWQEYHEGQNAYDRTKDPNLQCPYSSQVDAARAMEWKEGWEAAKREDEDGD